MPLVRAQVEVINYLGEPVKDNSTNTVFHTIDDSGFNPAVDYQNHANEIRDLFSGQKTGPGHLFVQYIQRGITVKVYDMADPTPRPERAVSTYVPSSYEPDVGLGPRQVALCVSYYATRNLPRLRGRIFIGPIQVGLMTLRPGAGMLTQWIDLGHGLFDIGGENVAHVVYSPTSHSSHVVTNYWCNDVWDTQRSRLEKESTRSVLAP